MKIKEWERAAMNAVRLYAQARYRENVNILCRDIGNLNLPQEILDIELLRIKRELEYISHKRKQADLDLSKAVILCMDMVANEQTEAKYRRSSVKSF